MLLCKRKDTGVLWELPDNFYEMWKDNFDIVEVMVTEKVEPVQDRLVADTRPALTEDELLEHVQEVMEEVETLVVETKKRKGKNS